MERAGTFPGSDLADHTHVHPRHFGDLGEREAPPLQLFNAINRRHYAALPLHQLEYLTSTN